MQKRTLVLAVLDGWGIGAEDHSNPIYVAEPKQIAHIKHTYPAGTLQASGIAVGLPWGEVGDSEVGHLTLGAGKVLYQHYPRITLAIRNRSFFQNEALIGAAAHAKQHNSAVHLIGLVGQSNVHSSLEHLQALIELMRDEGVPRINLHLITDGEDSPPKSAPELVVQLPAEDIVSIAGRYFAMDRDLHWDRTARVYRMLIAASGGGAGAPAPAPTASAIASFLTAHYARGLTDEFVEPTLIQPNRAVADNDALVFFNFREDSMRQLVHMFLDPTTGGPHPIPKNLYITTFTRYSSQFHVPVAFPPDAVVNPLGKVLSDAGRVQLRIAETSKYAHVTYFFNGFVEPPFPNEYRVLIPSRALAHADEHPEMMASDVTARVLSALGEGVYDFILVNYANADVVGHTGNFDAALAAVRVLDEQIGLLMKAVLDGGHILVITSDHGNAERMLDPMTGRKETGHETNPVPIYVITPGYERVKSRELVREIEQAKTGVLSDVAPTVLALMGIPKPAEMTGMNLLPSLV